MKTLKAANKNTRPKTQKSTARKNLPATARKGLKATGNSGTGSSKGLNKLLDKLERHHTLVVTSQAKALQKPGTKQGAMLQERVQKNEELFNQTLKALHTQIVG